MNAESATAIAPRETTPPAEAARFHSLDAVRAFALLLGVAFHAAESFEPGIAYWAIADRSPSLVLSVLRNACHSFRLELFFLIAGFFAHLLFHRRGPSEFIRNRLSRILVPLVVGWAVLYPLLVFLWLLGASVSGRLGQMGVPPELVQTPVWQLTAGFFLSLQFLQKFDLTHLWFLHQLLILYAIVLLVRAAWRRLEKGGGAGTAVVDRIVARLCVSRWNTVAFAAITVPMLMLMDSWGVDTPKASLLPRTPTTLLFGFLFATGWLLHRQPVLLEHFSRPWGGNLLLGLAMMLSIQFGGYALRAAGWAHLGDPWVRWAHSVLYALMMWGFMLGFLGLFLRFRRGASAGWRYVADASYWIYLVHLPLVVWLQILVARWPLHWTLKYLFILALAVPVLFLSYHCLARSTFIGLQLNGRKHPFRNPLTRER